MPNGPLHWGPCLDSSMAYLVSSCRHFLTMIVLVGLQVRGSPCDCSWPECCDSQGGGMPPTRMALAVQAGTAQAPSAAPSPPAQAAAALQDTHLRDPQSSEAELSCARASSNGNDKTMDRSGTGSYQDNAGPGAQNRVPIHAGSSPEGPSRSAGMASESQRQQGLEQDRQHSTAGPSGAPSPQGLAEAVQGCGPGVDAHDTELERMEARYVHSVYDIIATHFSATRFAIWPKVLLLDHLALFCTCTGTWVCIWSGSKSEIVLDIA